MAVLSYLGDNVVKFEYMCSACTKVLNSGLGPFQDQTAEMVLFFYTKVLFFPIKIIMPCNPENND